VTDDENEGATPAPPEVVVSKSDWIVELPKGWTIKPGRINSV
jgi:hypothetical protein